MPEPNPSGNAEVEPAAPVDPMSLSLDELRKGLAGGFPDEQPPAEAEAEAPEPEQEVVAQEAEAPEAEASEESEVQEKAAEEQPVTELDLLKARLDEQTAINQRNESKIGLLTANDGFWRGKVRDMETRPAPPRRDPELDDESAEERYQQETRQQPQPDMTTRYLVQQAASQVGREFLTQHPQVLKRDAEGNPVRGQTGAWEFQDDFAEALKSEMASAPAFGDVNSFADPIEATQKTQLLLSAALGKYEVGQAHRRRVELERRSYDQAEKLKAKKLASAASTGKKAAPPRQKTKNPMEMSLDELREGLRRASAR